MDKTIETTVPAFVSFIGTSSHRSSRGILSRARFYFGGVAVEDLKKLVCTAAKVDFVENGCQVPYPSD